MGQQAPPVADPTTRFPATQAALAAQQPPTAGASADAPAYAQKYPAFTVPQEELDYIDTLKRKIATQPGPKYTPQQIAERTQANDRDYALGMLGMASQNETLQNLGKSMYKEAMDARTPHITEHGSYNTITGEFTYDPDYLQQQAESQLGSALQRIGQQRVAYDTAMGARADRDYQAEQGRQLRRDLQAEREANRPPPAGTISGSAVDGIVDALGNYQMDPAQAFSRMPPSTRATIISQVRDKYPDYDPTTYAAKVKGARDFGSGPQGQALQKFGVSIAHIDQLTKMASALNNGDLKTINQIANAYGVQTGQGPIAAFNAVRQLVGPEVIGAIVAGGGGQAEREAAANLFSPDASPAAFAATSAAVRNAMDAKRQALLIQRAALHLPASSMPDYTGLGNESGGAAPPGTNFPATRNAAIDPNKPLPP